MESESQGLLSPVVVSQDLSGISTHGIGVLTTAIFAVGEMAGAGVLALPFSMNGTGYIGILLNVVCALVSAYTGMLLGKCWLMVLNRTQEEAGQSRNPYPTIGLVTFGRPGRLVVSCSINATLFGVSVVFLLLASENIQSLVKDAGKDFSLCYWMLIVAAALCPITWLGSPKDFWPIAVAAVSATSIACIILFSNIIMDGVDKPASFKPNLNFTDFFTAFGTICFAFGGHPAFPTFQTDMKNPDKFGKAIFIAYFMVLLMYLPVAISGYMVYGVNAQGNILGSVSSGPMLYIVEVLITTHLFCSYIIVINPVCQEIEKILKIHPAFNIKRVIFRTVMTAFVLFVAETIPNFGPILSLIGGSTTTLLAYILPPLFYLRLCATEGDWEKVTAPLHTKVACIEIMGLGLVAGVASTYSAVKAITGAYASTPCYLQN